MRNKREAHWALLQTRDGGAQVDTFAKSTTRLYAKPCRWHRLVNQLKQLWGR